MRRSRRDIDGQASSAMDVNADSTVPDLESRGDRRGRGFLRPRSSAGRTEAGWQLCTSALLSPPGGAPVCTSPRFIIQLGPRLDQRTIPRWRQHRSGTRDPTRLSVRRLYCKGKAGLSRPGGVAQPRGRLSVAVSRGGMRILGPPDAYLRQ